MMGPKMFHHVFIYNLNMNINLDKEIAQYVTNGTDKILPSRCVKKVLEKRNYYDYIVNRYTDNSTDSITEPIYRIVYSIDTRPVCKMCGKPIEFKDHRYSTYCSKKCVNSDPEVLAKNRENVTRSLKKAYAERGDSIKAKRQETLKRHFGESTVSDISGSSSPFAYKKVQEIAKATVNDHFGVDNVFKLPEFHTDTKEISRYRSKMLWKERDIDIEYTDHNTIIIKNGCNIHGDIELDISIFNNRTKPERITTSELCPICNPVSYNSGKEILLMKFFDELGIKYIANDRNIIKPLELDLYFPDYNIAIEINGIYFHSEQFGKSKDYHKHKTELCEQKGIQLIHIWEDDLINHKDLIFSMLKNKFGIYDRKIGARNCDVKIVSVKDATNFLNENHLQGFINAKYKFGLYYNDELVSVMTFGSLRKALGAKKNEKVCELYRYCVKTGTIISGGASKLFKHAVKKLKDEGFETIITYAKRDWSNGSLYKILGFEFDGNTVPGYFWTDIHGNRTNRFRCRKSEIVKTEEEKSMTEVEIMHARGYFRCYDSGNLKFHYYIND